MDSQHSATKRGPHLPPTSRNQRLFQLTPSESDHPTLKNPHQMSPSRLKPPSTCLTRGCDEPLSSPTWYAKDIMLRCPLHREEIRAAWRRHARKRRASKRTRNRRALAPKLLILRKAGYADSTVMLTLTTPTRSAGPLSLMTRAARLPCAARSLVDWTAVATRGPRGRAVAWSLHILFSPGGLALGLAHNMRAAWRREFPPTKRDKRAVVTDHLNNSGYFARNMAEPGAFRRNRSTLTT